VTIYLFLLFLFQFTFFLGATLGLFLLFSLAFILLSLVTHVFFSLFGNDLRRIAATNVDLTRFKKNQLPIIWNAIVREFNKYAIFCQIKIYFSFSLKVD